MKIAIIGAGAAGLCCARHFSRYPKIFQIQVNEQNKEPGGTWIYSPGDLDSTHSSIYKNLRTNLPKEIMLFPEFPFPSKLPSFPHHSDVLKYLQWYVSHYDLGRFIRFGTVVEEVTSIPLPSKGSTVKGPPAQDDSGYSQAGEKFKDTVRWKVTIRDVKSGQRSADIYDAVLVCNGHFFKPSIPDIPGLSVFPGDVIHSHIYREPEVYQGKDVLLVGGGESGKDLITDLSPFAKHVYFCNRGNQLVCPIPDNMEEFPGIAEIREDGKVYFVNGQERQVDSIIMATGYLYSFPFLNREDSGIRVVEKGKRVTPLYKHTFNSVHPSMAFIGINFSYVPFPYFDYQVRWVLSVWSGDTILPSKEEMFREEEEWYEKRLQQGLPPHKAGHYLGAAQWDMLDAFAKLGGYEVIAPVIGKLYDHVHDEKKENLMGYKSTNYVIVNRDEWASAKIQN